MSLNVLRLDVIISRLVEAVIVICINHILEVVLHIVARHTAIIHQAVLLKVVQAQAVQAAVIVINQIQQIINLIAVVLKKVLRKKRVLMILMMMDMMISIWMEIMTMTDTTVIVTTLTVWMMQWMSLEKTGKAEGGYYYAGNVLYNSWL